MGNFSQTPHMKSWIYMRGGTQHVIGVYTRLTGVDRKTGGFPRMCLSLKFAPAPLCCSQQSQADPSQRSAVRRGENPHCRWLGTSLWSPVITKETARSSMLHGGRNWLKQTQQCRLHEGGPLTSSAVHHIIKIPPSASLSAVMLHSLYHKQILHIAPWSAYF